MHFLIRKQDVLPGRETLEAVNSNQQTILLVEDEPTGIAFAREACALCEPPIRLVVVEDSIEALAWLSLKAKDKDRLPHLILLDLKLPKLSGLAVLRRLRMDKLTLELPIIVFSEVCEQSDILLSYQIGANSFVNKPVDIDQYRELLRELAAYWLQPRQHKLSFTQ